VSVYGQKEQPFFKWVTDIDGLSNNWIKTIFEDKDGFMWFGTINGLNRFNGHNFKIFQAGVECKLTDNIIDCLEEENQSNIWVLTFSSELNRYDRNTDFFTSFQKDAKDRSSNSGKKINSIIQDETGQF